MLDNEQVLGARMEYERVRAHLATDKGVADDFIDVVPEYSMAFTKNEETSVS